MSCHIILREANYCKCEISHWTFISGRPTTDWLAKVYSFPMLEMIMHLSNERHDLVSGSVPGLWRLTLALHHCRARRSLRRW
jgi:hypothetical protein